MHKILKHYIKITEFLGTVLGEHYEIILYQINNQKSEIIYILNNHITGKNIGDPLDELFYKEIYSEAYKYMNHYSNSIEKIDKTNKIKSSILFIKDSKADLIGLLCINCNVSAYINLVENLLKLNQLDTSIFTIQEKTPHVDNSIEQKNLVTNVSVSNLIKNILEETKLIKKEKLTIEDKMFIINRLYRLHLFQRKGVISEVAECLDISEPSVYRYISRVKQGVVLDNKN